MNASFSAILLSSTEGWEDALSLMPRGITHLDRRGRVDLLTFCAVLCAYRPSNSTAAYDALHDTPYHLPNKLLVLVCLVLAASTSPNKGGVEVLNTVLWRLQDGNIPCHALIRVREGTPRSCCRLSYIAARRTTNYSRGADALLGVHVAHLLSDVYHGGPPIALGASLVAIARAYAAHGDAIFPRLTIERLRCATVSDMLNSQSNQKDIIQ